MIKIRYNQNVAAVPVPICDACAEGHCSACEGGNCACQWTHQGEDWDELRKEQSQRSDSMRICPKCNGSGWVEDVCNHLAFTKTCELCDGRGKIPSESDSERSV